VAVPSAVVKSIVDVVVRSPVRTTVMVALPVPSPTVNAVALTRISVSTICSVAVRVPSVGLRPGKPAGSGVASVRLMVSVPSTATSGLIGTMTVLVSSPAPNSTGVLTAV